MREEGTGVVLRLVPTHLGLRAASGDLDIETVSCTQTGRAPWPMGSSLSPGRTG